jgi:hypothetical protein
MLNNSYTFANTLSHNMTGDGQSLPNMEVVAVHCRAGFSPISVTQKTKFVFRLPQTEYRETLAERNVYISKYKQFVDCRFLQLLHFSSERSVNSPISGQ